MPNPENILRPVVLISYGRSGTSLVAAAFDARGDCFYCGETSALITKVWTGVEFSQKYPLIKVATGISPSEHCSIAVQSVFLALFPSEKPIWFQKPIGLPTEFLEKIQTIGEYEAMDWYWTVLTATFPEAQFFTVLRNPYDMVISAKAFWDLEERRIWNDMRIMANFIMHPKSKIDYAVSFNALTLTFDEEILRLCSHLNLSPSPAMNSAKAFRHVPSPLSGSSQPFGYKPLWKDLGETPQIEEALEAIDRVWQRFGYQFERRPDRISPPVSA